MLEVCVDSFKGAEAAQGAGADRIELCSVLDVGGVTPTTPMIQRVRAMLQIPLIVLVRCRGGGFRYEDEERRIMFDEVRMAIDAGADGVAVGAIDDRKELDLEFCAEVAKIAHRVQKVMHRAFDELANPLEAMDRLCELRFDRILTSGGPVAAIDGLERLSQLQRHAAGRIEILPGGGVLPANAARLLKQTGCRQLHGSFRRNSLPDPDSIRQVKAILAQRTK